MLCDACERYRFPLPSSAVPVSHGSKKSAADSHGSKGALQLPTQPEIAATSISMSTITPSQCATKFVANELLSYTSYFRNRASFDALKKAVSVFYSAAEVAEAKKTLIWAYQSVIPADCPYRAQRRHSAARSVQEAEIDDIVSLFDLLDKSSSLAGVSFVAVAVDRLPGVYSPEDVSLVSLADRQSRTDAAVTNIASTLAAMTGASSGECAGLVGVADAVSRIEKRVESVHIGLQQQIDHLSSLCSKLADGVTASLTGQRPGPSTGDESERSMNVVVSGVAENKNAAVWREELVEVLKVAAGREVEIKDAFRLGGQYRQDKTRSILVRLGSVWDRRLILAGTRKLSAFDEFRRRVYISPDEPLDVRRRAAMDRLKKRAERDNKLATISSDGVLYVDNIAIFSLSSGYLCSINNGN